MHASGTITKETLWTQTLVEIKMQMTRGMFELHFAGSYPTAIDESSITVVVSNKRTVEQIEARLLGIVESTLSAIKGVAMTVKVIPREQELKRIRGTRDANKKRQQANVSENGRAPVASAPNERERVKIKGKGPTRASAIPHASFLQVSHYAIRFWLPVIGGQAFTVWQVINSYKVGMDYNWNGEPMVKDIMASAKIGNYARFWTAVEKLQKFGLLEIDERDDNKKSKHLFVVSDFPILQRDQHFDYLKDSRALTDAHLEWLQRFADRGFFDMREWWNGTRGEDCILVNKFAEN